MERKDILSFIEIMQEAEEYKPLVVIAIKAIKSYAPELFELLQDVNNSIVDLKAESVKRYMTKYSFSKEEAIIMTLDSWSNFKKELNKSK